MPSLEMTQEQKFVARLKQLLSESGLHEIVVFISADLTISFWIVKSEKVEGEKRAIIPAGSGEINVKATVQEAYT